MRVARVFDSCPVGVRPAPLENQLSDQDIDALRERWETERSRGLTLELAGEYRRRGEPERALEVLAADLEIHPEHAAARVAKGRCHLDLDQREQAGRELGQVAIQDPAHLDANQLLAELHIRQGDRARARDRLDLFELLGGDGAVLEALAERLESAAAEPAEAAPAFETEALPVVESEAPPAIETEVLPAVDAEVLPAVESEMPAAVDTRAPEAEPAMAVDGEPREASRPEPPESPRPEPSKPGAEPLTQPAAEEPAPAVHAARAGAGGDPDPFVLLEWIEFDESRYEAALVAEGLFAIPRGVRVAARESAPESATTGAAPAAAPAGEPSPTLTLGELYRKQGHRAEAAGIFRQILESQPGNVRAARALKALEKEGSWPLSADDLLGRGADQPPAGASAADLLRRYRDRLRGRE